jgi:hypothetical protein
MRWRLQRLENRWRSLTRRAEQRLDHIRYRHKVCPSARLSPIAARGPARSAAPPWARGCVRDRMIKWTLYTFIFGFAIGADNWAHAGGLALGVAIGAAVRPEWIRARPGRRVPLSLLGVAAVTAAVWLAVAPPASTMVP